MYQVIKRYGHQEGWSASYRNHRAVHSHCHRIHGYPLAFELTYESQTLDDMLWVLDFGGLKPIKGWLQSTFDHRHLVARDDPEIETFRKLHDLDIIEMAILPGISCEVFARYVYDYITSEMGFEKTLRSTEIKLVSVKVQEHEGNCAIYFP
jgi:6-pyruvoyltetrahydropterin/6-carboxytetrahydropterin synthase